MDSCIIGIEEGIEWDFSEIGVPPVIIHFNRIFHEINKPFWGSPMYGTLQMGLLNLQNTSGSSDCSWQNMPFHLSPLMGKYIDN